MDELDEIKRRKLEELARKLGGRQDSPNTPIVVTDASFDSITKRYPLLVVDCWAEWCAPCRMIAPVIDELARDYMGKAVFGKLNVDENPRTAARFAVTGIPTLLLIKDGKLVDRIVGAVPRGQIEAKLRRYL
jgi:thioredoxin 1